MTFGSGSQTTWNFSPHGLDQVKIAFDNVHGFVQRQSNRRVKFALGQFTTNVNNFTISHGC